MNDLENLPIEQVCIEVHTLQETLYLSLKMFIRYAATGALMDASHEYSMNGDSLIEPIDSYNTHVIVCIQPYIINIDMVRRIMGIVEEWTRIPGSNIGLNSILEHKNYCNND